MPLPPPVVLVVDDDPDFVYLLGAALLHRGATVESTSSAFGLVSRVSGVSGRRPDVVVLDCGLPALSGTSALALLAKNAKAAEVPVLLVSAAPPDDVTARLAAHPRARFIPKDGKFAKLAETVLATANERPR